MTAKTKKKSSRQSLFDKPQPVINRWFAMKFNRTLLPTFKNVVRRYLRIKIHLQEMKRSSALDSALRTTVDNFNKIQNSKHDALKLFFNIQLFFLIAEKDIAAAKIDALTHSDLWKRNLALRIILLVIHELDLGKVAPAKIMFEAYEKAGIPGEIRSEMNTAMKMINKAQSKAKSALSNYRHSTIAHRDSDAMLQYNLITNLDTIEIMSIVADFYNGADLFIKALPKALLSASTLPSLIKQMS